MTTPPPDQPVTNATPTPDAPPTGATLPGPRATGPRLGTAVWGLVVAALGAAVIAIASGARVDTGLAAIVLLAAAGLVLLIGSLVAAARRP